MRLVPLSALSLLTCLSLAGCPSDDDDDTAVVVDDDDTQPDDDDSGGPDDDDTGPDDDDSGGGPTVEEVAIGLSSVAISSRETLSVSVSALYSDGSEVDVTAEAEFGSSDEAVLRFYVPGTGQPLLAGTSDVTASWSDISSDATTVTVTVVAADVGDLVINEFLSDGAVDGDPNGDGSLDSVEDEFLEIANVADATVDLTGVTIIETDFPFLPRHTFADDTVLRAGEAIVVFGGGDASTLSEPHVQFVVAINDDPGILNGLSLRNTGDVVTIVADDGATDIAELGYGASSLDGLVPAPSDESAVLDPDVWGTDWVLHTAATGSVATFSPGSLADGSTFEGPDGRYGP